MGLRQVSLVDPPPLHREERLSVFRISLQCPQPIAGRPADQISRPPPIGESVHAQRPGVTTPAETTHRGRRCRGVRFTSRRALLAVTGGWACLRPESPGVRQDEASAVDPPWLPWKRQISSETLLRGSYSSPTGSQSISDFASLGAVSDLPTHATQGACVPRCLLSLRLHQASCVTLHVDADLPHVISCPSFYSYPDAYPSIYTLGRDYCPQMCIPASPICPAESSFL